MTSQDMFDLNNLRLPPQTIVRERRITVSRKITHRHFIKVPCLWAERLASARYIATYRVAHYLLYQHWKHRGQPIQLANGALLMEGVERRSKWRGLRELEQLKLITIKRRPRRSPLVTLHDVVG
jgi:hypothetical protein